MSKKIFRKLEPIEVEIEDIEGQMHCLKSIRAITADIVDEMNAIAIDDKRKLSERNIDQLVLIFGKSKDFFLRFDAGILTDIISFTADEIYNRKKK